MKNQMNVQTVVTECRDGVCTILLNRPQVLNALTLEMIRELGSAVERAAADAAVDVVVLRGAGGNFCSGADLRMLGSVADSAAADDALKDINRLLLSLHQLDKPVIAAIEGAAVGAGLNLALHADFVVASENAVLQEPFVHIGLTTDFGGTYLLPRLVGMAQAKRLAMLGERITGAEAEQIGLIYKAVPPAALAAEVDRLAAALRRLPKQALAATKQGLHKSADLTFAEVLAWEAQQQPALLAHPGFRALVESRLNKG